MDSESVRADPATSTGDRWVLVSSDCHVSPPPRVLRPYCAGSFIEEFDEWTRRPAHAEDFSPRMLGEDDERPDRTLIGRRATEARERGLLEPGADYDPDDRLGLLDADGIAAEVIFHGNPAAEDPRFPFDTEKTGLFSSAAPTDRRSAELAAEGIRIFNRWLADLCSVQPERHVGLAHLPLWDLDLTVEELRSARTSGLAGVNWPAQRKAFPAYNDPYWEPFWSEVEDLGMTLHTHVGASDIGRLYPGPEAGVLFMHEGAWLSRQGLAAMVMGGVFERHPGLRLIETEQPGTWFAREVADMDSALAMYLMSAHVSEETNASFRETGSLGPLPITRLPSEYVRDHVFVGASFMSRAEARTAWETGWADNVMWGSDFPHMESTAPMSSASLRLALEGIPEDAARKMAGLNAVRELALDLPALERVAARIGPTADDMRTPLAREEIPNWVSPYGAWRLEGTFV